MTTIEKLQLAVDICYTELKNASFNCNQKGWSSFEISSQTILANQLKLYHAIASDIPEAPKIEKTDNGYLFNGVNFIVT